MGIFDQITSRPGKALKELSDIIAAASKGEPCPDCGEVHEPLTMIAIPIGGDTPQDPAYSESDGLEGEYEYTPKTQAAVQFLPHNVPYMLEFLYDHGVSFGHTPTGDGESRILLVTPGQEADRTNDELRYGRWAVVRGSREGEDLAYTVLEDALFRQMFRLTARVEKDRHDSGEDLDWLGDGDE